MELLIMDSNFAGIGTLDVFESLIWTDRYYEAGDFEIYMPASVNMINTLKEDLYLYNRESEHIMVIEDIQIDTDVEDGAHLTVTGRSLESLLERRIIWNQTTLSGSFQDGIKKLLDENAISPSDPARVIPNLIFSASDDPKITNLSLNGQYWGENLYETVEAICESAEVGWKITLNESNQMVFSLYAGTDRSYNQTENPYVIFSPSFDNLLNSNYVSSGKTLKTVTMVTGEGEGTDKKSTAVECSNGAGMGLVRREMYTDASSVSQQDGENEISDSDYIELLKQKGIEDLAQNVRTESFEGEVSTGKTYAYGIDYFMGDVVQNVNEFNVQATSRVVEYVMSQDTGGLEMYPTFASHAYYALPEGYSQVEYIDSTGSEYIDTGFTPNQNTRVICEFGPPSSGYKKTSTQVLFGSRENPTTNAYALFLYVQETKKMRDDYGKSNSQVTLIDPPNEKSTADKNKHVISINETQSKHSESIGFNDPVTMSICALKQSDGVTYYATVRIYSLKIYSSSKGDTEDLLIRNFIPVKNPDDEYGLFDVVERKFYGNVSGNGEFVGPQ